MVVRRVREDELYHHGVKGQRWGVRRYQNPDGTLTAQGEARLAKLRGREIGYVKKRMAGEEARYIKKNDKLQRKIEAADAKGNVGRSNKLTDKSNKLREHYEKGKSIGEKEIKALNKYKLSDFSKEQHNINVTAGKAATKAVLTSVAGTMILNAAFAGTVVNSAGQLVNKSYRYYQLPSINPVAMKTNMRMKALENGEVRTLKAEAAANRLSKAKNDKQKEKFQQQLNEQLEKDKRKYG